MKAFNGFMLLLNGCVLLGWFVVFIQSQDKLGPICFAIFGGGALAVIDVIWLIIAAVTVTTRPKRHEAAIIKYLRRAEELGMSDEKTVAYLRRNGWSDSEIQDARRNLSP